MKKNAVFLLILLQTAIAVPAQQIKMGLKADFNFFRVNGDGMSRQFHPGINGGIFAGIRVADNWSIEPGILYSQRNTKASNFSKFFSSSVSLSASNDVFLSYISLPLLVKYKLIDKLSVEAGIQYNYLLYADENLLKDNSEVFKKNDFGLIGGADYAISKRLDFYGQFYYGLTDINNVNSFHNWKVQQFQAGAAYTLFIYK